jgi:hypothetical protein
VAVLVVVLVLVKRVELLSWPHQLKCFCHLLAPAARVVVAALLLVLMPLLVLVVAMLVAALGSAPLQGVLPEAGLPKSPMSVRPLPAV